MYEQILIITAQTLFLCTFILISQLYIAKILLKNVNSRITQLDSNLAEALNNVIEGKLAQGFEAPNPLVSISLIEIARRPELLSTIGARAMNPQNIINIAVKSAVANFGFRFARRAVSRPVRLINKQLRMLNLGVTL